MSAVDPRPSLVERLFAEHGRALLAFIRRRIRTKADAPDLAQEAYSRMLRVSDPEAIRDPVRYLFTVARNLVKEHAARAHRQATGARLEEVAHERLETLPEFEGDRDEARRVERLRVVLKQLSPKCQEAVAMRFTDGLTYHEIAVRLGVSRQMAKKYVEQALIHCRRRMARLG